MLQFNEKKENCSGCSACYSICPKHCISMKPDKEGFLYPELTGNCIQCGLCEKVCPQIHPHLINDHQHIAFAALSKDVEIWRRSSSGGAFSEVCKVWSDDKTLLVGAAWDGLNVHHITIEGYDGILPLCKSKYVSSAIEDCFIEVKKHLKDGFKVVFSGCPCQVEGLKHYLGRDYPNLLTIDLICHGQGSPIVFKESIKFIENELGKDVKSYSFRAKRSETHEIDHLAEVKTKESVLYIKNDPYIQLFLSQKALRPSCGKNCQFRDGNRPGDITLADFKGLWNVFPKTVKTKKNYSTIVSNSDKGDAIIKELGRSMELIPCDIKIIEKYNPLFSSHTWFSQEREKFFELFADNPQEAIRNNVVPFEVYSNSWKKKLFWKSPWILRYLAIKLYLLIKR